MSQITISSELGQYLPEAQIRPGYILDDSPCPVCGQVCPNDAYCINCGYLYDPLLKKYLKREQTKGKRAKQSKLMENRNPDGSYKYLPSGVSIKQHAIRVKLDEEYKRQNGKAAKIGDVVRKKNLDGFYNKSSVWYIFTPEGWNKSPSKKRKPAKTQIKRVCQIRA
ncbi:hypothetical protein JXL21_00995 [Candidatus Bathyarchaeota archaeon]|nr:hypothetical protein [Candidatus Bathyarchaeota archaeon]